MQRAELKVGMLAGRTNRDLNRIDRDMRAHVAYRREREGDNPKTLRSVFARSLDYGIYRDLGQSGFVPGMQRRFLQMVEETGLETSENKSTTIAEAIDRHGSRILRVSDHEAIKTYNVDKLFFYGSLALLTMPEDFDRTLLVDGKLPVMKPEPENYRLFRKAVLELRKDATAPGIRKLQMEKVMISGELGREKAEADRTGNVNGKHFLQLEIDEETKARQIREKEAAATINKRFLQVVADSGITRAEGVAEFEEARETQLKGFGSVTELFQTILKGTYTEGRYKGTVDYINTLHDRSLEVFRDHGVTREDGEPYTSLIEAFDDDAVEQLWTKLLARGVDTNKLLGREHIIYLTMMQALIYMPEDKQYLGVFTKQTEDMPLVIEQLERYCAKLIPIKTIEREEALVRNRRALIQGGTLDADQTSRAITELRKDIVGLEHDKQLQSSYLVAQQFLVALQTINFTADDARSEISALFSEYQSIKEFEKNWRPFIVEHSGERTAGTEKGKELAKKGDVFDAEAIMHDENPRIVFLNELLQLWGVPRQQYYKHMRETKFEGTKSQFIAVMLPAFGENGEQLYDLDGKTPLYHAVVESPDDDNAVFVWRAESGRQPGGWHKTWKSVFARPESIGKREASKLHGVRRIVHTGEWQARVLDYLTRPESGLDRRDYKDALTTKPQAIEVFHHLMESEVA